MIMQKWKVKQRRQEAIQRIEENIKMYKRQLPDEQIQSKIDKANKTIENTKKKEIKCK
jgi:hypothetical protein